MCPCDSAIGKQAPSIPMHLPLLHATFPTLTTTAPQPTPASTSPRYPHNPHTLPLNTPTDTTIPLPLSPYHSPPGRRSREGATEIRVLLWGGFTLEVQWSRDGTIWGLPRTERRGPPRLLSDRSKIGAQWLRIRHQSHQRPRHTADGQGMCEMQAWQALLAGKGIAAALDALDAYGMLCEDEVSLLRETDLSTLDMQLKPLHENTSIEE